MGIGRARLHPRWDAQQPELPGGLRRLDARRAPASTNSAVPPFGFENALTTLRLADAALAKGYRVNLFASADAVYAFERGQKAAGLPDPVKGFSELIARGLRVELCGSCLTLRGIGKEGVLDGSDPQFDEAVVRLDAGQ